MASSRRDNLRVISGEGKKKLPSHEKKVSWLVLAVFAFILIMVGYHWIDSWLYFRRVQVVAAREEVIDSNLEVQGVISRYEEPVPATEGGVVLGKVPEGERVPVDGEVLTLLPDYPQDSLDAKEPEEGAGWFASTYESIKNWILDMFGEVDDDEEEDEEEGMHFSDIEEYHSVKSPHAGMVSYSLDGWENEFIPEYPYDLLMEGEVARAAEGLDRKDVVKEGENVFKIVDNWKWYFSLTVDIDKGRTLANKGGAKLTFSFAPDNTVQGSLVDVQNEADMGKTFLTYQINRQIPGFTRHRWAEVELNYRSYEGIKVPEEALVQKEDELGVYLNRAGVVTYQPVEVIYQQGEKVLVEELSPGSMVITRPDMVSEGQRLD